MNCSRCGSPLVPGARFCDVCGAQFAPQMGMGAAVMGQGVGYPPPPRPRIESTPMKPGGLSIAALVTGIVSVVTVWAVFLAIPLAICGVVFGAIGLGAANRGERGGRGFAITGITTGVVTLGILIIAFVIGAAFVSSYLNSY